MKVEVARTDAGSAYERNKGKRGGGRRVKGSKGENCTVGGGIRQGVGRKGERARRCF